MVSSKQFNEIESSSSDKAVSLFNDIGYQTGDTIIFKEYSMGEYSGRELTRVITDIWYVDGLFSNEVRCYLKEEKHDD